MQSELNFTHVKHSIEKIASDKVNLLVSDEDILEHSFSAEADQESLKIRAVLEPAKYLNKLSWISGEWKAEDYSKSLTILKDMIAVIESSLQNRFMDLNQDQSQNLKKIGGIYRNVLDLIKLRQLLFIGEEESLMQIAVKEKVERQIAEIKRFVGEKTPVNEKRLEE